MSKKAVSILIGYVLLISFAIIMGAVVYGWMKSYIPKDLTNCPEGSAVFIKDVSCNIDTLKLKLTLENRGRFDIAGYFIHATNSSDQELATIDLSQKRIDGGVIHGNSIIFASKNNNSIKPGTETEEVTFDLGQQIYSIELIPVRFQLEDNKERFASCKDAKVKQIIICSTPFTPLSMDGLISWWNFDNVSDNNVVDIVSSKNGTLQSGNCSVVGQKGLACFFNESGDYIDGDDDLDFTNFTAMAFVNISGNGVGDGYSGLFNSERGTSAGFEFAVGPDYEVWMMIGNTSNNDTLNTSADVIIKDTWQHITITGISGQYMRIYVNGVEQTSKLTTQPITDSGQRPYMGTYDTPSNGNMNGTIDELMIFNRSLSKTEIDTIIAYFS